MLSRAPVSTLTRNSPPPGGSTNRKLLPSGDHGPVGTSGRTTRLEPSGRCTACAGCSKLPPDHAAIRVPSGLHCGLTSPALPGTSVTAPVATVTTTTELPRQPARDCPSGDQLDPYASWASCRCPLPSALATQSVVCPAAYRWNAIRLPSGETSGDRKSTRLNSSHGSISYAVFCLKKKKKSKSIFSLKKKQKKKNI